MLKVIIDFLSSQQNTILKAPVPFIVIFLIGFALGFWVDFWIQKNKIETNEERLKLKEQQIEYKDNEIQKLERQLQLACPEKLKQNDKLTLEQNEILALKAIRKFQQENPCKEFQKPAEYSVDNLVKDLSINLVEANEILKNLRNYELFDSIWDNIPKYANLSRLINETQPGRLSKAGWEFLSNYSSDD